MKLIAKPLKWPKNLGKNNRKLCCKSSVTLWQPSLEKNKLRRLPRKRLNNVLKSRRLRLNVLRLSESNVKRRKLKKERLLRTNLRRRKLSRRQLMQKSNKRRRMR